MTSPPFLVASLGYRSLFLLFTSILVNGILFSELHTQERFAFALNNTMSDKTPSQPAWPLDGPAQDSSSPPPLLQSNLQWLALVIPVAVAAVIYVCLRIRNMRRHAKQPPSSADNQIEQQQGWLVPSSARRHAPSSSSCLVPASSRSTRRLPLVRFSDPLLQQPPPVYQHPHRTAAQYRSTYHERRHHRRRARRPARPRTPPPAYPRASSPPPPAYDDIVVVVDRHDNEPLAHLQNALLSHHQHYASSVAAASLSSTPS